LYADDLKAYCPATYDDESRTFNTTMAKITEWSNDWQLPISTEKSKWLLITNKKSDSFELNFQFELGGKTLPRVFEALDLGINFNSRLTFKTHISIMITKAKQRLFCSKKFSI